MELEWTSKWDELSKYWGNLEPPAVPSQEDIALFMNFLEKVDPPCQNVAILGSTPALRIATSKLETISNVYCIDFSTESYEELTNKLTIDNEIFIKSNWLEMNIFFNEKPADAILGDKSIDNLPKKDWSKFFLNCNESLTNDGSLILHVGYPDNDIQTMQPIEIIKYHYNSFLKRNYCLF